MVCAYACQANTSMCLREQLDLAAARRADAAALGKEGSKLSVQAAQLAVEQNTGAAFQQVTSARV